MEYIKKIFKERCSITMCFKKPYRYMQMSAHGIVESIPFCKKHTKLVDEMMKNGEIKIDVPVDYEPLKTNL